MKRGSVRALSFSVAAIVLLLSVIAWQRWSIQRQWDLGNKPVGLVFSRVFGVLPPAGAYNMKVAGMPSLSGVVWMRFQVRNIHSFLAALKHDARVPINGPHSIYAVPSQAEADRDPYSHAVDWDGVYQIRFPEHYDYGPLPNGSGWFGEIVVDRSQRTIYVHGGLM